MHVSNLHNPNPTFRDLKLGYLIVGSRKTLELSTPALHELHLECNWWRPLVAYAIAFFKQTFPPFDRTTSSRDLSSREENSKFSRGILCVEIVLYASCYRPIRCKYTSVTKGQPMTYACIGKYRENRSGTAENPGKSVCQLSARAAPPNNTDFNMCKIFM